MRHLLPLLFLSLCGVLLNAQVVLKDLFAPLYLSPEPTELILSDYLRGLKSSSIELPPGLSDISTDPARLLLVGNPLAKISTLKILSPAGPKSLVLIKSSAKVIPFVVSRKAVGKNRELRIVGSFNNWDRQSEPMKYNKGAYSQSILLEPGRYEYKLFVDGKEQLDPNNRQTESDGDGGFNNIIWVEQDTLGPAPYRLEQQGDVISVHHEEPAGQLVAMWQNIELEVLCKKNNPPICLIRIPEEAKSLKRSYLRLYHYLEQNKGSDQLIPLEYGRVITSTAALNKDDWHASSFYFVALNLFNKGDSSSDKTVLSENLVPPASKQNGNLAGFETKVRDLYFERLGITNLWVSAGREGASDAWTLWRSDTVKRSIMLEFDKVLQEKALKTFARSEGLEDLKFALEAQLNTKGNHHLMVNSSNIEGRERFISIAKGPVLEEGPTMNKTTRGAIKRKRQASYKRLALLQAFNFSIPGIPGLYFGDEIGLHDADNSANKPMMYFENWTKSERLLHQQIAELSQLRKSELPLLFGSTTCFVEGSLLFIKRDYFGQVLVTVFNLSEKQQTLKLPFEMDVIRELNQVHSGLVMDGLERKGLPPIKALSFQIFANY